MYLFAKDADFFDAFLNTADNIVEIFFGDVFKVSDFTVNNGFICGIENFGQNFGNRFGNGSAFFVFADIGQSDFRQFCRGFGDIGRSAGRNGNFTAAFPLFSLCLEKINFALKKQKSILKILSPKDKIPRYSFA